MKIIHLVKAVNGGWPREFTIKYGERWLTMLCGEYNMMDYDVHDVTGFINIKKVNCEACILLHSLDPNNTAP